MLTPLQLEKLIERTEFNLGMQRQKMLRLREELASVEQHIIAAQGVLAALYAVDEQPYDPDTVPLSLDTDEPEHR